MIRSNNIAGYLGAIGMLLGIAVLGPCKLLGASQSAEHLSPYQAEEKKAKLFDDETWEEWRKKQDEAKYLKDIQKAQEQEKKEANNNDFFTQNSKFLRVLATILLILIGIIVAFYVLRQLMGMQIRPKNRKIDRQSDLGLDLETIEDQLEEVALEDYIRQAIEDENYILAIRLYYLEALKTLSQNRQITWKKDKTNRDYLWEMQGSNFFVPFQEITRLFERAWYGDQRLEGTTFRKIAPNFERFIHQIKEQTPTAAK